jgi:hypothetical protein
MNTLLRFQAFGNSNTFKELRRETLLNGANREVYTVVSGAIGGPDVKDLYCSFDYKQASDKFKEMI